MALTIMISAGAVAWVVCALVAAGGELAADYRDRSGASPYVARYFASDRRRALWFGLVFGPFAAIIITCVTRFKHGWLWRRPR